MVAFCYLKSVLLFTLVIHPEVAHVIVAIKINLIFYFFFTLCLNHLQSTLILMKSDLVLGSFYGDVL